MPFAANILTIDNRESFDRAVAAAAALLKAGGVVAIPTETVYGLAANALDPAAIEKIYAVKNRPTKNPVIVHVNSIAMARRCVSKWPAAATILARHFWPGPLTMVLPKSAKIPSVVTAGGSTVGIRWPIHPFVQALISACDFPLAAPSANPANQLSPTAARHVAEHLGKRVGLIIDGGACAVGIESTVVDLSEKTPRILRPGIIDWTALKKVLPDIEIAGAGRSRKKTLRSPGQMERHYSPRARLIICAWTDDADLKKRMEGHRPERCHVIAHERIPQDNHFGRVSVVPHDPIAYARALYAELHECDAHGAELIIVEAVPETSEWSGIADRLRRASVTA